MLCSCAPKVHGSSPLLWLSSCYCCGSLWGQSCGAASLLRCAADRCGPFSYAVVWLLWPPFASTVVWLVRPPLLIGVAPFHMLLYGCCGPPLLLLWCGWCGPFPFCYFVADAAPSPFCCVRWLWCCSPILLLWCDRGCSPLFCCGVLLLELCGLP